MMKMRGLLASCGGLALLAAPSALAAQDAPPPAVETVDDTAPDDAPHPEDEMAQMAAMFGTMFQTEPLTPEQEARIPAAERVVGQIFPAGTYARMMNDTMKPMMDGIMGSMMDAPLAEIAKLSGLPQEDLPPLGEGSVGEVMAILDPAFEDRTKLMTDVTFKMVAEVMTEIEPAYRSGLSRAYAVRFSEAELTDLNTYFATPVGAKYAAESMLIYSDPQVMSAMNEMMPAMLRMMPDMMAQISEASAQFPAARTFSQLTPAEQQRLAELLGVSVEALQESEPEYEVEEAT